MHRITTRPATLSDLDILLKFEQGIITTERPFDPTLKTDPISYYNLEALIPSEDAEVIVAIINEEIVASGYALIKYAQPYVDHESYAYLGFMFVPEVYRGQGINKIIVDALKEWAYSRGLKEIRLEVYAENINAIKAYEKVGFKAHMLEMRFRL
ncbi:MAG: GNAT family N-acetyltransferase [Rhizobacter sp.]|nr:GNAT family N-acetyltransferase [Ferruginibacter sp.]